MCYREKLEWGGQQQGEGLCLGFIKTEAETPLHSARCAAGYFSISVFQPRVTHGTHYTANMQTPRRLGKVDIHGDEAGCLSHTNRACHPLIAFKHSTNLLNCLFFYSGPSGSQQYSPCDGLINALNNGKRSPGRVAALHWAQTSPVSVRLQGAPI